MEAITLENKIFVMESRHIQQAPAPLELYQQPANLFIADFIGSPKRNLLQDVVREVLSEGLAIALAGGTLIQALDTKRRLK